MLSNGAAAPHARNGSVSGGPPAEIPPYRHMSSGSLNIPNGLGQQPNGSGQSQAAGAMAPGARFEGPRSPPGKQSRFLDPRGKVAWCANAVLQTHRMCLASSSAKARARRGRRVHSVTTSRAPLITCASTLQRLVARVYLR